jgi:molybdopterin/thiamine biosynthesis adenylyltransferase
MSGGFGQWKNSGLPFEQPRLMTDAQTRRYSRHMLIPEVGEAGQFKLLDSKVLLIGAGGLGSPAAYYLAAAGVGTIGIIDADVVDDSNLQRQILHNTSRIGEYKAESARETIEALNPDVKVVTYIERLDESNVARIIADYDLIIDGTDNFPTRYLLNDAAIIASKPVIHGSVFRFEGQLTVFKPHEGPCYRCLYPEPPPAALAPSCAEAGVLGVLPGIIGILQATEAIKLLLNIGEPLVGRMMTYDALAGEFSELRLYRDPNCPACGEHAHPEDLPTYAEFCAL